MIKFIRLLLPILLFSFAASATLIIKEVDYFASMRSKETNVRSGPGQNYPIKFTFKMRGIPVHVINEYDNWSEIEDYEGHSGWVINALLTKKRTLMVRTSKGVINMYKKANEKSRIILKLENNVLGEYIECEGSWCKMKVKNKKGWVKKEDVFGSKK